MPSAAMDHQGRDPADLIYKAIGMKRGKLPDGYEVYGNRVLLAVYEKPEKTKGGILLTQQTRAEEQNQGKACLVIAKGPAAFKSDANYDFCDQDIEVGDWVSIWVYEARPIKVEGYPCRLVRDTDISMRIPAPDQIY